MKRCIFTLLLFCTPLLVIHALPRKKVAVVLSGGGAKGVAHIGALKVIEELGIPIDYVAGTSIGAIVGGLYSIGYTPEQLEIIVKQTNWIELLTDKISRDAIPFPFKLDDSKYLISLPYNNSQKAIMRPLILIAFQFLLHVSLQIWQQIRKKLFGQANFQRQCELVWLSPSFLLHYIQTRRF